MYCIASDKCFYCSRELTIKYRGIFDTRFGIKSRYSIAKCPCCDVIRTIPPPNPYKLSDLYKEYYNYGGEKGTAYTRFREWFLSSILHQFWIVFDGDVSFHGRKGHGRLLDIGCNEGRGLGIFRKNGFDPEGLEQNEVASKRARAEGFIVYTEQLETFQPIKLYDVVVLSNVIEHSLDPKLMLYRSNQILKDRGEIWISCPNVDSWQRTVFGKYWINWHVPFHIVHFSQGTLTNMLKETGFEIQEIRQKSPALWVAHSIIVRLFAKFGQPSKHLRNAFLVATLLILIRIFFFPLLCLGNRLGRGDCIIAIARKQKL